MGSLPGAATPIDWDSSATPCWLLSLNGDWIFGTARAHGDRGGIWLTDVHDGIRGGMSGSPIVAETGAIGVVASGGGSDVDEDVQHEGGPEPRLTHHLPCWLFRLLEKRRGSDDPPGA
jgi:hypothetical protein